MTEQEPTNTITSSIEIDDQMANPESSFQSQIKITQNESSHIGLQNTQIKQGQKDVHSINNNQFQKSQISGAQKQPLIVKNVKKIGQQKQEKQQQQNKNQYNQLSHKLQSALDKIQGTKNKKLNKSSSLNESVILRFQEIEERKKKQIKKKKEELQMNTVKQLKQKPTIDKNSAKISKELGHQPIHLRVEKLVEEKKRKFEQNQELKKKRQEEEVQKYLQQLSKCRKKPENMRSYDQYFSEMVRWKEKTLQENKDKFETNKNKELEGITFKPTLNKKSQKMIASQSRLPIQNRPLKKKKYIEQSMGLLKLQKSWNNPKM